MAISKARSMESISSTDSQQMNLSSVAAFSLLLESCRSVLGLVCLDMYCCDGIWGLEVDLLLKVRQCPRLSRDWVAYPEGCQHRCVAP